MIDGVRVMVRVPVGDIVLEALGVVVAVADVVSVMVLVGVTGAVGDGEEE